MRRNTYRFKATGNLDPDDVEGLSPDDVASGLRARLGEFYVGGLEVRTLRPVNVRLSEIEVETEDDGFAVLLARLEMLKAFHADDDGAPFPVGDTIDEALVLLRTHALPEDHPAAIR